MIILSYHTLWDGKMSDNLQYKSNREVGTFLCCLWKCI